jgi:hypothetical protein
MDIPHEDHLQIKHACSMLASVGALGKRRHRQFEIPANADSQMHGFAT